MVTGKTQHIVMGHPGALIGKPAPNYKPPPARPVPREKPFWLRIDREKGHQLFTTQSDTNGIYSIELPAGRYIVTSASNRHLELKGIDHYKITAWGGAGTPPY